MKRKKIIIPVVFVCILSTAVFLKSNYLNASKYKVNYMQDGSEVKLTADKVKYEKLSDKSQDKITTYKTVKPVNATKDIENILKIFEFSNKYTKTEDVDTIYFDDGVKKLQYLKNTGGVYYKNSSLSNTKSISSNEVTNVKYYEMSEDILKKLGVNTILRKDITPSGIIETGTGSNKITEFYLLHVTFVRELGGKKVMGFDKIMFDFNYNGELASAMISIRDYQEVEQVAISSPKKAFEKYKSNKIGYIETNDSESTEAEVTDSELIFWVEEINKTQITKPIYSMKGKTIPSSSNSDKKVDNTLFIEMDAIE